MNKDAPAAFAGQAPLDNKLKQAYQLAYELGADRLRSLDPVLVASHAKIPFDPTIDAFRLRYLGVDYDVFRNENRVERVGCDGEVPVVARVLMVHYLTTATGEALSGRAISFKELPNGGAIYCSNFQKRAINPFVKRFSEDFDALYRAAAALGGSKAPHGHAAVELPLFPAFPVRYVVWQGDEEIPASGTILFDATADSYLPVEDIVVAASEGAYALIRTAGF